MGSKTQQISAISAFVVCIGACAGGGPVGSAVEELSFPNVHVELRRTTDGVDVVATTLDGSEELGHMFVDNQGRGHVAASTGSLRISLRGARSSHELAYALCALTHTCSVPLPELAERSDVGGSAGYLGAGECGWSDINYDAYICIESCSGNVCEGYDLNETSERVSAEYAYNNQ